MYPKINIFNIKIDSGWLMLFIGFALMVIINLFRSKKFDISKSKSILASILVNVGAIFGAKLLYVIENIQHVLTQPISFSGFSFFGTVLILPIFLYLVYGLFSKDYVKFLNFCTPTVILELTLYRFGCFLSGCCYGVPSSWGVAMHHSPDVLRIPIQLFEVFFDFLILFLVLYLERKSFNKNNLYVIFIFSYCIIRFILEFWRVTPKIIGWFSFGQLYSIIGFVICFIYLYREKRMANEKK